MQADSVHKKRKSAMFQALLLTQNPEGITLAGVDSVYAPPARHLPAGEVRGRVDLSA